MNPENLTVEFLFDFASPNAYLAHKMIPNVEGRTGVSFNYVPVYLGGIFKETGNKPPLVANAHVPSKKKYEQLEFLRFLQKNQISNFRFSPYHPIKSVYVMRGALVAAQQEQLQPYVDAVMSLAWEKQAQLESEEDAASALTEVGFDGASLMAAAGKQEIRDKLFANTEAAIARGVFGVPTYFIGAEMYFGKDRLRDLEEEITRKLEAQA